MRIVSGTTDQYIYFVAVDATDLNTRETGLTSFTVRRSRNGGASVGYTAPTINETDSTNMPGVYELLLDEDTTIDAENDTEEYCVHITHGTDMAPVTRTIELYRPKITTGYTLGVESDGDLTKVNTLNGHTAQTGDTYSLLTSAQTEPTNDPPPSNATPMQKLGIIYAALTNKLVVNSGDVTHYNSSNVAWWKKVITTGPYAEAKASDANP